MLFLVESSLGLMTSLGFMSNFQYNRKSSVYYDGNNRNKNHLREIDYKLSRQKGFMKRLIKQKKGLIKNMTGIDLSLSEKPSYMAEIIAASISDPVNPSE